jgi:hypothetical protein
MIINVAHARVPGACARTLAWAHTLRLVCTDRPFFQPQPMEGRMAACRDAMCAEPIAVVKATRSYAAADGEPE